LNIYLHSYEYPRFDEKKKSNDPLLK